MLQFAASPFVYVGVDRVGHTSTAGEGFLFSDFPPPSLAKSRQHARNAEIIHFGRHCPFLQGNLIGDQIHGRGSQVTGVFSSSINDGTAGLRVLEPAASQLTPAILPTAPAALRASPARSAVRLSYCSGVSVAMPGATAKGGDFGFVRLREGCAVLNGSLRRSRRRQSDVLARVFPPVLYSERKDAIADGCAHDLVVALQEPTRARCQLSSF
jgi:hypothetical protein